jgi:hypothetical protein
MFSLAASFSAAQRQTRSYRVDIHRRIRYRVRSCRVIAAAIIVGNNRTTAASIIGEVENSLRVYFDH